MSDFGLQAFMESRRATQKSIRIQAGLDPVLAPDFDIQSFLLFWRMIYEFDQTSLITNYWSRGVTRGAVPYAMAPFLYNSLTDEYVAFFGCLAGFSREAEMRLPPWERKEVPRCIDILPQATEEREFNFAHVEALVFKCPERPAPYPEIGYRSDWTAQRQARLRLYKDQGVDAIVDHHRFPSLTSIDFLDSSLIKRYYFARQL